MSASSKNPGQREVLIKDNQYAVKYKCSMTADLKNSDLVLPKDQTCELAIETPDFCLLKKSRCDARTRNLQCGKEKVDGHLGVLTGTLISGTMSQLTNGDWTMSMKFRVDGCVLANGHNNNAPTFVRGATLTVVHP